MESRAKSHWWVLILPLEENEVWNCCFLPDRRCFISGFNRSPRVIYLLFNIERLDFTLRLRPDRHQLKSPSDVGFSDVSVRLRDEGESKMRGRYSARVAFELRNLTHARCNHPVARRPPGRLRRRVSVKRGHLGSTSTLLCMERSEEQLKGVERSGGLFV